ncbi:MAG: glycosyltransferase family 39 protein [Microcoleus sp.]
MAVGLLAVSPFHVLYAQEARPYSLWSAMILFSSASLLRAMRRQTKLSWGIYSIATILGVYTHLFSLLVAVGHGIYVLATQGFRWNKTLINYLIATAAVAIAFIPWTIALLVNQSAAVASTGWAQLETSELSLVKNWAANIGRVFFDFGLKSESAAVYLIPLAIANLVLLAIVGYAIYTVFSETDKKVWLFLAISIAVTALAVMLPDVILGGIRSTKARYLFPTYFGIQIAVAYLLATKISGTGVPHPKQQFWKVVTVVLLTCGVLSDAVSSNADVWWTKELGTENPAIARTVNQSAEPLLLSDISEVSLGNILSMSHLLEPKVKLQLMLLDPKVRSQAQLVADPTIPDVPQGFSDVFVYGRSNLLSAKLAQQQNYQVKVVAQENTQILSLGKLLQK